MRPSNSLSPSAAAPVPLAFGLPRERVLVRSRARRTPADSALAGDGSPALRYTGVFSWRDQGLPGYWAVLFARAAVEHPARPVTASPLPSVVTVLPSSSVTRGATWLDRFVAAFPRPTRSRAYAQTAPLPRRLQGSLSACRAQRWLSGFRTRWTAILDASRSSLPPSFQASSARSQQLTGIGPRRAQPSSWASPMRSPSGPRT